MSNQMSWPLRPNWECEVCGGMYLEWGLQNGRCFCPECGCLYSMRTLDEHAFIVDVPICLIRPEPLVAFKRIWKERRLPFSEAMDVYDEELKAMEAKP